MLKVSEYGPCVLLLLHKLQLHRHRPLHADNRQEEGGEYQGGGAGDAQDQHQQL